MEKGGRKGYITGMEEVPGKGKELSHSAHANGMHEMTYSAENVEGWVTGTVQHSGTDCVTGTVQHSGTDCVTGTVQHSGTDCVTNTEIPNIPTQLHDDYWKKKTTGPLIPT